MTDHVSLPVQQACFSLCYVVCLPRLVNIVSLFPRLLGQCFKEAREEGPGGGYTVFAFMHAWLAKFSFVPRPTFNGVGGKKKEAEEEVEPGQGTIFVLKLYCFRQGQTCYYLFLFLKIE